MQVHAVPPQSAASMKLRRQTNCTSANVIYLINQCEGKTKRGLNERVNSHRANFTKRRFQRSLGIDAAELLADIDYNRQNACYACSM